MHFELITPPVIEKMAQGKISDLPAGLGVIYFQTIQKWTKNGRKWVHLHTNPLPHPAQDN